MIIHEEIKPKENRSYEPASITIQHPPITKIVLSRDECRPFASAFPHRVNVTLLYEKGEGAVYNVGGAYHSEIDAEAAFNRADEALKNGGIIKILNDKTAAIEPLRSK